MVKMFSPTAHFHQPRPRSGGRIGSRAFPPLTLEGTTRYYWQRNGEGQEWTVPRCGPAGSGQSREAACNDIHYSAPPVASL
jgi:hypothetical protein